MVISNMKFSNIVWEFLFFFGREAYFFARYITISLVSYVCFAKFIRALGLLGILA